MLYAVDAEKGNRHCLLAPMLCCKAESPPDEVIIGYVRGAPSNIRSKDYPFIVGSTASLNRSELECEFKLTKVYVCPNKNASIDILADLMDGEQRQQYFAAKTRNNKLKPVTILSDAKEWLACSERLVKLGAQAPSKSLQKIRACCNLIRVIPDELCGASNKLRLLYLARNQLNELPEAIGNLEHLEVLDVSSNFLKALPRSIGQCRRLRDLRVANNLLTSLPDELSRCPLAILIVKNNIDLHLFPHSISRCKIRVLSIEGCSTLKTDSDLRKIVDLCNSAVPMPSLVELCARKATHCGGVGALKELVDAAKTCELCRGLYFEHYRLEGFFIDIAGQRVPTLRRTCGSCLQKANK